MKKTLITLAMLATSTAFADMVYSEDYADSANGYYSTAALQIAGNQVIDLSAANLNTTDGFTISLNVQLTSTGYMQWSHILGLSFDDSTTNANTEGGEYCFITTQGKTNDLTTIGVNPTMFDGSQLECGYAEGAAAVGTSTWYNVALTVSGDQWTVSLYTEDGLFDTTTLTCTALQDADYLTKLYIGGTQNGSSYEGQTNNRTTTLVDTIAVYDSVLSADELATLAANSLSTGNLPSVPEPSTATLSLLALAGLCARRRRK